MPVDQGRVDIEDKDRGYGAHVVGSSHLSAEVARQVETNDGCLSLEVSLNPIHDGLRHQAGGSRIAEELDHDGLAAAEHTVE